MKRQIRRNCFETNSSSTHAICITKRKIDKDNLPSKVEFKHDEFGWEFEVYEDVLTKASYLYQAICDLHYYENDKRKTNISTGFMRFLGNTALSVILTQ